MPPALHRLAGSLSGRVRSLLFADTNANPTVAGQLQRSGSNLRYHDGTEATTVAVQGSQGIQVTGGASPTSLPGGAFTMALGGGGSSPNSASIAWGDGSGWHLRLGPVISGVFTPRFEFIDQGAFVPAAVSGTPAQHGLYRENVVKGWVVCNASGVISDSFNVSSITDNGVGSTIVTWDRDFSNTSYCVLVSTESAVLTLQVITSRAVGTTQWSTRDASNVATDPSFHHVLALGDQ